MRKFEQSTFNNGVIGTLNFGSLTAATLGGLSGLGSLKLSNSSGAGVALRIGNNSVNTTYAGALTGAGSVTKVGSGSTSLTGLNSYAGTTTILAGTLDVAGYNSLPGYSTPGKINVANGAMLAIIAGSNSWTATSIASLLSSNGTGFAKGSTFGIDTSGGSLTYAPNISGNMGLWELGGNALILSGSNTFSGPTTVAGGTLTLGNALALQQSTLDTSGSGLVNFGSLTAGTLGGLTGTGTLNLANASSAAVAFSVGNNSVNTTYSGALQGPGSLTKTGSGTLVLAGTNSYTGGTIVTAGTLVIANPFGIEDGTSLSVGSPTAFNAPAVPTASGLANGQILNVVPEPSTLALLGTGAVGLAGCLWWRKDRKRGRYRSS